MNGVEYCRYRYEGPVVGFTLQQLQSIRSFTVAKLVCENMDDPNPFVPPLALVTIDNQANFIDSQG